MGLTLNQIVKRIETISLAHKQVRTFKRTLESDQENEHTTLYPAVYLNFSGGQISITGRASSISFNMMIVDLVNVSEATGDNEDDVLSDTLSIAQDLIAQMSQDGYSDWRVNSDDNVQFVIQSGGDMRAGVQIDFTVTTMYTRNLCSIPSDLEIILSQREDMKLVYDIEYIADGTEGYTLSIPQITGKKVLMVIRENNPLHRVSNAPSDTAEFSWNDILLTLGAATSQGERFLTLYRNY